jgi:hypothetical protein
MSSARLRRIFVLPAAATAVLCTLLLPQAPAAAFGEGAQALQRSMTVAVLDRNDAPVTNLDPDAIVVREDGVAREVVRISPAPPPTEIVLLIDDSQATSPALRELRAALNAFANEVADYTPPPAVRLATFGDRPTTIVDFNPSFSAISRGIERIAPRPGSGATFLEAVVDTGRALRARKAQRPVIVAFVAEAGPEFGTLRHTDVARALQESGASLWTIVLTQAGGGGDSDAERERQMVLGDVTTQSGGKNRTILSSQNLSTAFSTLAGQLTSRWEITYGRADTLIPPKSLEISTRDNNLRVLSPRWARP